MLCWLVSRFGDAYHFTHKEVANQACQLAYETCLGSGDGVRVYPLREKKYIIGRAAYNDIELDDIACSRHHCVIEFQDNKYWITDLRSSNGTKINNQKIKNQELQSGDRLQIGHIILTVMEDAAQSFQVSPPLSTQPDSSLPASSSHNTQADDATTRIIPKSSRDEPLTLPAVTAPKDGQQSRHRAESPSPTASFLTKTNSQHLPSSVHHYLPAKPGHDKKRTLSGVRKHHRHQRQTFPNVIWLILAGCFLVLWLLVITIYQRS